MLSRFARFNVVGAIGFVLQVALLTLLVRAGVPVVAATLVAVEAAVLHNFAWHERWTWGRRGALGRFHLTNGAISLAGNIVVTPLLISEGVPLLAANLSAVIACALINFLAAQLVVFREAGREEAEGAETSLTQGPLRGRDRGARAAPVPGRMPGRPAPLCVSLLLSALRVRSSPRPLPPLPPPPPRPPLPPQLATSTAG